VRKGSLDPDLPTSKKFAAETTNADEHWKDPATIIRRHQELTDDQINQAFPDELRAAYRSLRDHHAAETTALIARRDDLAKRCEDNLAKSQEVLAACQKLLAHADGIM